MWQPTFYAVVVLGYAGVALTAVLSRALFKEPLTKVTALGVWPINGVCCWLR